MKKTILIMTSLLTLSGCVTNDMSDLQTYVQKIKATHKGTVKPLPVFKTQASYVYGGEDIRDPFKPVVDIEVFKSTYGGLKPDPDRPREPLEDFSLDSLRMVGTLAQKASEWILVKDPDGLLHRVSVGHYMGKNYGKVTAISEEEVVLTELIADKKGGWEEREASIALSE
jgi:type IV pilus assembly protein PilP